MLVAWKAIRPESGAPITTHILLEGLLFFWVGAAKKKKRMVIPSIEEIGMVNGAPLSVLITFKAANIWGKFFSQPDVFLLDLYVLLKY